MGIRYSHVRAFDQSIVIVPPGEKRAAARPEEAGQRATRLVRALDRARSRVRCRTRRSPTALVRDRRLCAFSCDSALSFIDGRGEGYKR